MASDLAATSDFGEVVARDLHSSMVVMRSIRGNDDLASGEQRIQTTVTIDADPQAVFDLWLSLEALPQILDGVRRVQWIAERRVLWEVNVAGRQLLWEAELTAIQANERIAWASRRGTPNRGEMRFVEVDRGQTRVEVDIAYTARGLLQRIGARLGLVRRRVDSDLARFRRFVQCLTAEGSSMPIVRSQLRVERSH